MLKPQALTLLFLVSVSLLHGSPSDEIASFSLFDPASVQKLPPGEILTTKPPLMSFERGLAVETCFLAPYPIEQVKNRARFWDQTPYADLGVYLQGTIDDPSAPNLEKLKLDPSIKAVRKLLEKSANARENDCPLHLSKIETELFSKNNPELPGPMTSSWNQLLVHRFNAYRDGGLSALPAYDAGRPPISPVTEYDSIFSELAKISNRFKPLLDDARSGKSENAPTHYWQLANVDGTAVLSLGTVFTRDLPETGVTQVIDLQWYVSGGYYVSATCLELHSIQAGKTPATLIWRGDYTAISMKQMRKGVERLFSVNIMLQEVKKSIRCFLQDLSKEKS